jgi:hypothetical protein
LKKYYLLFFTTLLATTTLTVATISEDATLVAEQIQVDHGNEGIAPTGLWFTEDNELP